MTVGLDELYGLGYRFFETMDEKYRAVTRDDIQRVANAYFTKENRNVAIYTRKADKGTGGKDKS